MAKQGQGPAAQENAQPAPRLGALAQAAQDAAPAGLPPVHLWNPPFCGDIDIRIGRDGTWFYLGSPIGRPALVRLFSSVLKREAEDYFLVTPVEKVRIQVEDAPFLVVEMRQDAGTDALAFRTNVDDWVVCDAQHGLRFDVAAHDGLVPYLHVRANLWGRLTRALYYDLMARGEERVIEGRAMFGIASGDAFFAIADAEGEAVTGEKA